RDLLSKKVLLLHDNEHSHKDGQTVETINNVCFEVLEHPTYSPDLALSDYHFFGPLKDVLQVGEAVHKWLRDQQKIFFVEGICKVLDHWTKCIEKGGHYFLRENNLEVVPHAPYSPDLAPSDFWLFPMMKDTLRGRTFTSRAAIASAIFQWSKQTPAEAFAAAMESWCRRCEKCVRLQGDYLKSDRSLKFFLYDYCARKKKSETLELERTT
ncbi:hypothetical protein B7P43_G05848, partial [Cryptotermes secundus]